MRKALLFLLAAGLLAAGAAALYWQRANAAFTAPGPHESAVQFAVKPGSSVRAVLAELAQQGVIADRRAVELVLRVRGWPQIKSGRYEFPAHESAADIVQQLAEGRVLLETLTVIEGW